MEAFYIDTDRRNNTEYSLYGWKKYDLGDLCIDKGKYGINAPAVNFVPDLPAYIRITDINENGKFSPLKRKSLKRKGWEDFLLEEGDILFVRTGSTTGKSYLYKPEDGKLVYAGFLIRFRPIKSKLLPEFLAHFTSTSYYKKWVSVMSVRSGQPGINSSEFSKLPILTPPIEEQTEISRILSTWDEAIDKTQSLIDQLQLRKKGLMQELLTGNKRLPGFSGEWKKYEIGELSSQFTDKNKDNSITEVLSCTKYDGLVKSLEYFGRKVYGDDLTKYKVVPHNHFAYATNHIEEGSIGYQNLLDAGLVSPMYTVFKTNSKVDDSLLYRLLKTDRMLYQYQSNMSGSIARRGGLRWAAFKELIVKLPPVKEQKALAAFFNIVDEEINSNQCYLKALKHQKKGLMQQLLTGKKRVNIE